MPFDSFLFWTWCLACALPPFLFAKARRWEPPFQVLFGLAAGFVPVIWTILNHSGSADLARISFLLIPVLSLTVAKFAIPLRAQPAVLRGWVWPVTAIMLIAAVATVVGLFLVARAEYEVRELPALSQIEQSIGENQVPLTAEKMCQATQTLLRVQEVDYQTQLTPRQCVVVAHLFLASKAYSFSDPGHPDFEKQASERWRGAFVGDRDRRLSTWPYVVVVRQHEDGPRRSWEYVTTVIKDYSGRYLHE